MVESNQIPPKDEAELPRSGLAIASLVLGIIGIASVVFPELGIFVGLLAIVFGAIGLTQVTNGTRRGQGFAIAGLVLGIIGLVLAAFMLNEPAPPPSEPPEQEQPQEESKRDEPKQEQPREEPAEEPEQEPAPKAPEEEPAAEWTTVIELSGNANKRSEVFELEGGDARLIYDVQGDQVLVMIYLVEEGESLEEEGGIPEVTVSEPGSDTTFLAKSPGQYYLDITSANADWTVQIEEKR